MNKLRETGSQKWLSKEKLENWNQEIFSVLWKIWAAALAVELLLFVLYQPTADCSQAEYFSIFVLRPSGVQLFFLILFQVMFTKVFHLYRRSVVSLYTIVLVSVLAGTLVCVHTSIDIMPMLLLEPMLLTPLYKDWRMSVVQAVTVTIIYIVDCFYFIPKSVYMPPNSHYVEITFFVGTLIATLLLVRQVSRSGIMDEERSKKDSLTRLYNHETFYEELEYRRKKFEETGEVFAVIMGDIDNFKKINDTYGHAFGDTVICRVAELFQQVAGGREFCARYGGEEFTMIASDVTQEKAKDLAEQIRKSFSEEHFCTEVGVKQFTISFGVALYEKEQLRVGEFFECVDKALYEAKSRGKNCVVVYEDK